MLESEGSAPNIVKIAIARDWAYMPEVTAITLGSAAPVVFRLAATQYAHYPNIIIEPYHP